MKICRALLFATCLMTGSGCGDTPTTPSATEGKRPDSNKSAAAQPENLEKPPPQKSTQPARTSPPTTEPELALARAKIEGKMVFIEFSASWCPPCQQMKRDTFANPRVQAKLAEYVTLFLWTPTAIRSWPSVSRARTSRRISSCDPDQGVIQAETGIPGSERLPELVERIEMTRAFGHLAKRRPSRTSAECSARPRHGR